MTQLSPGRTSALALALALSLPFASAAPQDLALASHTKPQAFDLPDDNIAEALGLVVPMIADGSVPKDSTPFANAMRTITFGLPIPREAAVPVVNGRPKLKVGGGVPYQFKALDLWPEGTVKWAFGVLTSPVSTGNAFEFDVTDGAGVSSAPPLATEFPGRFEIDTGPMQLVISKFNYRVFSRVDVDGAKVVDNSASRGIVGTAKDGTPLSLMPGAVVTLEENGPARAIVRMDGTMVDVDDNELIDVTCRIIVGAKQREAEVILTVRNANIDRPAHAQIGSLGVEVKVTTGATPRARANTPYGAASGQISASDEVALFQAYSKAVAFDVTGTGPKYKPPIPKITHNTFEQEGWKLALNDAPLLGTGKEMFNENGCIQVGGNHGGVTAAIKHMPHLWPAAFEFRGDGTVKADVFSALNPAGFDFIWRQHESRSMAFAFHAGLPIQFAQVSRRLDNPALARAVDYNWYDDSGVFPYPLVTIDEQNEAFALAGIQAPPPIKNDERQIHRFLPAGSGGGHNNHSIIERWLIDEFLRTGHGGQLQRALDLAIYKSEWQIPRSDNFHHAADPGPLNPELEVTDGVHGDSEHRYREGMIYAYYMTGDTRIYEALQDELEVVPDLYISEQERSMYQTMRALVYLADFVDSDPEAEFGAELPLVNALRARIDHFCKPVLDVNTGADGYGWEAAPGQGLRGYYANSNQAKSEKPDGENYITRGFITGNLGATAMSLASKYLGEGDVDGRLCADRLLDIARYTRKELYPFHPDPAQRFLVYSYGVQTKTYVQMSSFDFHTILLGMAEGWRRTGNAVFIEKGIEVLEAIEARGHLDRIQSKLDNQSFYAALGEFYGQG